MKVAVLGGFGLMAEAALHDLAADHRVTSVLAADVNLSRAKGVLAKLPNRAKVRPVQVDVSRPGAAAKALKGCDVLINCAWYELNLKAMDLAVALGAHYADLGGLYHMTVKQLRRDSEFKKKGLIAVLGCGSTPGITNMMAARMSGGFETIDTVGIYDASHDPALSHDQFLPPFSIRTMLAEYEQAAPVLADGRMREAPAHGAQELMEFKAPIGRVSAGIVIHSETATLPDYFKEKGIRHCFFKIAYPDSVRHQLQLLVAMGLNEAAPLRVNGGTVSPREFVTALAQKSMAQAAKAAPAVLSDFEVLRVKVTGRRHGRSLAKVWDCEIRPTKMVSAGAAGVGFTAAIAGVMAAHRKTQIPAGVGGPESVLDHEVFFKELKKRKVFSLIETIAHPLTV